MPLLIGLHEKEALAAAMARAREQPLPLDVVVHRAQAIDQATNTVTLAERKAAPSPRAGVQNVALPFGYRVAISFEEQPAGMCLHLSMSSGAKDKLPAPEAINMVLEALGIAGDVRSAEFAGRVWIEEFEIDGKAGGHALNVVAITEPAQEGHA